MSVCACVRERAVFSNFGSAGEHKCAPFPEVFCQRRRRSLPPRRFFPIRITHSTHPLIPPIPEPKTPEASARIPSRETDRRSRRSASRRGAAFLLPRRAFRSVARENAESKRRALDDALGGEYEGEKERRESRDARPGQRLARVKRGKGEKKEARRRNG